jgi:sugar lactone lactonase YvrE
VEHVQGYCDGLAVDDDGCLWVPLWDAGAVVRVEPSGRCVARVELDARQPSDCCLVEGLLVITTATEGMHAPGPADGLLHVVEVGVGAPPVVPYGGRPPWSDS